MRTFIERENRLSDGYSAAIILARDRKVESIEVEPVPLTRLHDVVRVSNRVVRRVRNNGQIEKEGRA